MKKKIKKISKKKDIQKKHFETRGLFILSLNVFLLVSLITFSKNNPNANWLGYLGHYLAYILTYLFGLSSYLFSFFLFWIGIKLITKKNLQGFFFKGFSFFLMLISMSFLLTIYSDSLSIGSSIENKVFTDQIFFHNLKPYYQMRYNLGGSFFYYIYKDLPFLNLKKVLSSSGCTLIFFTTFMISFLLFTGLDIITTFKNFKREKKKKPIKKKRELFKKLLIFILEKIKEKREKKKQKPLPATQINIKQNTIQKEKIEKIPEKENININTKVEKIIEKVPTFLDKLKTPYYLPPTSLLTDPQKIDHPTIKKELSKQAEVLEETLKNFGIEAKVGEINCGPTITSFEVHPSTGVKVQKIKSLENDIALNMEAKSIRIIAPIPGKAAVGVEVPSIYPQEVSLKEMIQNYQMQQKKMQIPILLGKTVTGDNVIADLTKMPHLLIAGATGSGKSVCVNSIVVSILMNVAPDNVKLLMIDPKKVELTQYSNLPHMLAPVITEAHGAYAALQWLVREMQNRYDILKQLRLRNITAFNLRKITKEEQELEMEIPEKLPLIVGIFDEFADLMMVSSGDLETPIARIAQMARAVGIHLILATQRPSREVITGIIKANFPSRIAFKVSSRINSQIILDEVGAEQLLGNGDLLFSPPAASQLIRAQGAYIRDDDINKVIDNICEKYPTNYLIPSFDNMPKAEDLAKNSDAKDALYDQALNIIISTRNASTTFLQRKLKIGYARAASIMDELETNNVIGPQIGSKPRKVLSLDEEL